VSAVGPVTAWVNGRIVDAAADSVSALDRGLTLGLGAFETLLIRNGEAFAITRHLLRLGRSSRLLGLPPPEDAEVRDAVAETLAAAGPLPRGRLRITLTAGPAPSPQADPAPPHRGVRDGEPTLILTAATAPGPGRCVAVTLPWVRNERSPTAGAKCVSYAENVLARDQARRLGADEALLANTRGELCEGTASNVFVLLDGVLVTPPLSSGCLPGVTRELLLEWAAPAGLPVLERELPFEVLRAADEVLLTSSLRGVQPIEVLDGRELPPNPARQLVVDLYRQRSLVDIDP
jgi:branched-chain amino acid aminotransferase